MKAGSFFGEMALLHNKPRNANVTARTNVELLSLSKEAFEQVG